MGEHKGRVKGYCGERNSRMGRGGTRYSKGGYYLVQILYFQITGNLWV